MSNAFASLGAVALLSIDAFLDGIILSRLLGHQALGAVTLLSPFMIFQSALASLVATGASVLISRAVGEDNDLRILSIFKNMHILAVVLAVMCHLAYLIVGDWTLHTLSSDEQEILYAHEFYSIFSAGTLIVILSQGYGALMRSSGQFGKVSMLLLLSVLINVLLSLILIPKIGIAGCSWAMLTSLLVYSFLAFSQIQSTYRINFRGRISREVITEIFSIGFSSFIFQSSNIFRQALIIKFISIHSAGDTAFYGIISRVIALMVIPTQALFQSFQPTFIANLGAGLQMRCQQAILAVKRYSVIAATILCAAAFFLAENIFILFFPELKIPKQAFTAFRMCLLLVLCYPLSALSFVLLQSSGNHKQAVVISSGREVVLLLPLLLLLNQTGLANGVYIAIVTEVIIYTSLIYVFASIKMNSLLSVKTLNNQVYGS
ncbi:MAG: MATE family efflux transporter [Dyadobacter sp.]|uniref:MATE family efflux transporter n=1 Tax=Dyadobacter sp. TaxID=1914288 RepID=UPI0032653ECA